MSVARLFSSKGLAGALPANYLLARPRGCPRRCWPGLHLALSWLLLVLPGLAAAAQAQAPAWAAALGSLQQSGSGTAVSRATAVNAAGDVLVAGSFTGQAGFGATTLSSAGGADVFLAKYSVSAGTWAWAVAGGGTSGDVAYGLAVSGASIYLTGTSYNNSANASNAQFGSVALAGATATSSQDVFLARYTDAGSTATCQWAVVGGGTGTDYSYGVAVSGASVYLTGYLANSSTNDNAAQFGGTTLNGTTAGAGGVDVFLAKYTDNGASAAFGWAVAGGGNGVDYGTSIAASGSSVYVTGAVENNSANLGNVQFGGVALAGTSPGGSQDVFLAKYTDAGSSATCQWAVAGGGTDADLGYGLAVSGPSVYVTGSVTNTSANANGVKFGGVALAGASGTASADAFLAKYTDVGSSATCQWAVAGGGTSADVGYGVAVSGPSVYVTGSVTNTSANAGSVQFGGAALAGASPTSSRDVFVAKYTDQGSSAAYQWATAGGGPGTDVGYGVAVSSAGVQVAAANGAASATASGTYGSFGPVPASSALSLALNPATGAWQRAATPRSAVGTAVSRATAANAAGDVFVTGSFSGQVGFGATTLSSAGGPDVFVAKYSASAGTWVWAVAGGGTSTDIGYGLAVSGSSVYVTGYFSSTSANAANVQFGGVALAGTGTANNPDVFLAKYTDQGSSAAFNWAAAGGGTNMDGGFGVAVSGPSVYVTGAINANSTGSTTSGSVQFGGTPLASASATTSADVFIAKYTDQGSSATYQWATAGGGTGTDYGNAIAVSGSSVYVTGYFTNTGANDSGAQFGGAALAGASPTSSQDVFVAKYTDQGSSAAYQWATAGGGTAADYGYGLAVSGSSVYVTGISFNNSTNDNGVQFGGTALAGASPTASADVFIAKYLDQGSSAALGWATTGGGTGNDVGYSVAVSGPSVYVTGYFTNTSANDSGAQFGGAALAGASATSGPDVFLAKYLDAGSSATCQWATAGGGTGGDYAYGLAVSGQTVYVTGQVVPPASFGSQSIGNAVNNTAALASLVDNPAAPLPVQLTTFTATAQGTAAVRLAWVTASEQHSARFEVERSPDGAAWVSVGTVAAAGTTATAHTYGLTDALLPTRAAALYYRLRQIDLDGSASYSPVRVVALGGGVSLYPNPTTGAATLSGLAAGTPVRVYDAVGQLVLTATADAAGAARLALPAGLPAGVYVVRVGTQALRLAVE